jgi:hypothetical protein
MVLAYLANSVLGHVNQNQQLTIQLNDTKQNLKSSISILNQTTNELIQTTYRLTSSYNRISNLTIENGLVTNSLQSTKWSWNVTKNERDMYQSLVRTLDSELNLTHGVALKSPTYRELTMFLENDTTNLKEYKGKWLDNDSLRNYTDYYVCTNFAKDVLHNALGKGLECSFVSFTLYNTTYLWYGHAMICFNTTDRGIVIVEPQNDHVYFDLREGGIYDSDWIYDLTIVW